MELENSGRLQIVELTADVVSAYVSNNSVPKDQLADLIRDVHSSLNKVGGAVAATPEPVTLTPAVNPKKSVTPDFIICLEDGKKFKSLKRHISSTFGMTPEEYRTKWNLPKDYPMVAPNYSATRSALAKSSGLGRKAKVAPKVRKTAKRG
ncbi:MucR family transcriptional regulator [Mesorhizobium sp. M8A.F.Ca.ET.021.01.1.1]|uniref:MucR family transcriptional regulator n=1 Tax=Mesorhizobium sp. M8A.F.Ca.ET.021.01.1.1 TaxID=2496757 RepID=UPI000FCCDCA6|nr:MucR family transcriptional regulator [Mesorhizobium sp. M8A.F.Ca.ET.021.01.1.1]RUW56846.1 transcriptional regulator [Mesorhizobium sp. M8A.F.Ca.ET.021.01.1.1]